MSWPTAHRSAAARELHGSGFQEPGNVRPPSAANSNMPSAANDNWRTPSRRGPSFGKAVTRLPSVPPAVARALPRALAGLGRIVLPGGLAVSAALLLIELYRWWREYHDHSANAVVNSSMLQTFGWSLAKCSPALRGTETGLYKTVNGVNFCTLMQSVSATAAYDPGLPGSIVAPLNKFREWIDIGPALRYDSTEIWSNPNGVANPKSAPGYRQRPHVWPGVPEMIDPLSSPVSTPSRGVPMPIPFPLLPSRQPNPYRSPTEQTEWGNEAPVPDNPWLPSPALPPAVWSPTVNDPFNPSTWIPVPLPDGTTGSVPIPDVSVRSDPRGNRAPELIAPGHRFKRPPRRTKEKKVRALGSVVAFVNRYLVNPVTETSDVVDAFWDALPEKFRKREMAKRHGKPPTMLTKMQQIYDHYDDLNGEEVMKNLFLNELEDAVFGKIGKKLGEAAKRDGRIIGYQSGPAL